MENANISKGQMVHDMYTNNQMTSEVWYKMYMEDKNLMNSCFEWFTHNMKQLKKEKDECIKSIRELGKALKRAK